MNGNCQPPHLARHRNGQVHPQAGLPDEGIRHGGRRLRHSAGQNRQAAHDAKATYLPWADDTD